MHRLVPVLPFVVLLMACPKDDVPDEPVPGEVPVKDPDFEMVDMPSKPRPPNLTPATGGPEMPSRPRPKDLPATAVSDAGFAFRLLQTLPDEGDVVLGPSSLSLALGLLGAGAAGDTESALREALGVAPDIPWHAGNHARLKAWTHPEAPYTLAVANRIYAAEDLPVNPDYVTQTAADYGAGLERLAFGPEARVTINGWVSEQTREMIPELLPAGSIDQTTRSVLVNAVYLKADWKAAFDPAATREAPFHRADGTDAMVPLMNQTSDDILMGAVDGVQVAALPYAGDRLQMMVWLPTEADGLPALETRLAEGDLGPWLEALTPGRTRLFLPKFEARAATSMNEPLTDLGLGMIFGGGDFSGIASEALTVSAIFHEAVVEVDEVGTEAAAATAIVMTRSARPVDSPRLFRADRPFLYAVVDPDTGSVLFLGRYTGA